MSQSNNLPSQNCGCLITASVQGQVRLGSAQTGLVENVPYCGRGLGINGL